jgi:hypothetical protein
MKLLLIVLITITLTGCSGESQPNNSAPEISTSLPNSFFTTDRPSNVKDLIEIKKTAKVGDDVTFLARIGGRKNASFVSSAAMMIVADPGLRSCELMIEKDHCATPEDYCCEDKDQVKQSLATIRFMDDEDEVYPFSVEGTHDLETLKFIVVQGTVIEFNDYGLFMINANKVWVGGKPSYGHERDGSEE